MSFLTVLLGLHITLGELSLLLLTAAATMLWLNRKQEMVLWLAGGAALFIFLSWFAGGYYYVVHYGSAVKPIIKSIPSLAWVHSVVMEQKEYVFLFLPPVILSTLLVVWHAGQMIFTPCVKRTLLWMMIFTILAGATIAVQGFIISSTVRDILAAAVTTVVAK